MAIAEDGAKAIVRMPIVHTVDGVLPGKPSAVILARRTIREQDRRRGPDDIAGSDGIPKTVLISGEITAVDTITQNNFGIPFHRFL